MARESSSNGEIAATLSVGRDAVRQWRKRFFHERLPGLEERARPGRPPARQFPPQVVVQIKALACELPASIGLTPLAVETSTAAVRLPVDVGKRSNVFVSSHAYEAQRSTSSRVSAWGSRKDVGQHKQSALRLRVRIVRILLV